MHTRVRSAFTMAILAVVALALTLGAASSAAAAVYYVDATSGNDANACTSLSPCKTIGRAIAVNGGASGATIQVGPGTYHEMVVLSTTTNLVAQGAATIDATGLPNGIVVNGRGAGGSTIQGFTVENANAEGILAVSASRLTISNNTILNNDQKHDTDYSQACATNGNVPGDCGEALHLMGVSVSHISSNDIEHNIGGILVTDETGPSHGNLIEGNTARNNAEDCGITLPSHNPNAWNPLLGGVYGNVIRGNLSQGNGGAGVGMFAPFPGTASYANTVAGNTLIGNGEAGVAIHAHTTGTNVARNVIVGNTISGNGVDPDTGSGHPTGIAMLSVDPTLEILLFNHVSNEYWGLFVNGPLKIATPSLNVFDGSVSHPFGSP